MSSLVRDFSPGEEASSLQQAMIHYVKTGGFLKPYGSVEKLKNELRKRSSFEAGNDQNVTQLSLPKLNKIDCFVHGYNKFSERAYSLGKISSFIALSVGATFYLFEPSASVFSLLFLGLGTGCGSFLVFAAVVFDYHFNEKSRKINEQYSRFNEIFGTNLPVGDRLVTSGELCRTDPLTPARIARPRAADPSLPLVGKVNQIPLNKQGESRKESIQRPK